MPRERPDYDFKFGGTGDYTDGQANSGYYIEFYHLVSGNSVLFKAFVTKFADQFKSEWNEEDAYGRMDPISTFKRTRRTISMGWDIPAASSEEARENLRRCSILFSMLYPSYESNGVANVIKSPPLMKMKFMNLSENSSKSGKLAEDAGLLGYVDGFTYEPDMEQGVFHNNAIPQMIFPKLVKLGCQFTVLHQQELGWNKKGERRGQFRYFPYSADAEENIVAPPNVVTIDGHQAPGSKQSEDSLQPNDSKADSAIKVERNNSSNQKSILDSNGHVSGIPGQRHFVPK